MNDSFYINQITHYLHVFSEDVRVMGTLHLFDQHIHAEYMFRDLLNVLLSAHFVNANDIWPNEPGIDLVDMERKTVVQVSSQTTPAKIQHSLDTMNAQKYSGFCFVFLPITILSKSINASKCTVPENVSFDPEKDIHDFDWIISMAQRSTIEIKKSVYELLKLHLGESSHPRTQPTILAQVVMLLNQENVLDGGLLNQVSFEIDEKIRKNSLEEIETAIRDSAIYRDMLVSVYESAEREGKYIRTKIHNSLRHIYMANKAKYSSVELYYMIRDVVRDKVLNSSNLSPDLFAEDIEWGVDVIMVDAFEACKIFEHPTK